MTAARLIELLALHMQTLDRNAEVHLWRPGEDKPVTRCWVDLDTNQIKLTTE
jgi:hypothetical protein